jgi:hypothetical protein
MATPPKSAGTDELGDEIDAINARLDEHEARLDALEANGGSTPEPPDPEPPQPSGDWPDASNTGCSGSLSAYTGNMNVGSNVTIQDKKFPDNSTLRCQGSNIKIINCSLTTGNAWGFDCEGSNGIIIERCTIIGKNGSGQNSCILTGSNGKVRRCNLSKFENGVTCQDGACEVSDSYIHTLGSGPEGHVDGISIQGAQNGTVIRHNHVESYDTSCVFIKCDFGPITNTTVENNRLINAPGKACSYTVYSIRGNSGQTPTGTKIIGNTIQKGTWGYWSTEGSVTKTGNKDYQTGNSIDSQPGMMTAEGQEAAEARTIKSSQALGKKGK